MSKLSKNIRKEARALTGKAYKRELDHHLAKLGEQFDDWRKGSIDCWELSDLIHQFHDGISREVYKTYHYSKDQIFLISRALVHGFLKKEELSEGIYKLLLELPSFLRESKEL